MDFRLFFLRAIFAVSIVMTFLPRVIADTIPVTVGTVSSYAKMKEDGTSLNKLAWQLGRDGDALMDADDCVKAIAKYNESIAASEHAIAGKENISDSLHAKCVALYRLSAAQKMLSKYIDAENSLASALSMANERLALKPDSSLSHLDRGSVLVNIASLDVKLARYAQAQELFIQALQEFDKSLLIDSDNVVALRHKAFCLERMGNEAAELSDSNSALLHYNSALDYYKMALVKAPTESPELSGIFGALCGLCEFELDSGNVRQSEVMLGRARDFAKQITPSPGLLISKLAYDADLAIKAGNIARQNKDFEGARQNYDKSLKAYEQLLLDHPEALTLMHGQAFAMERLESLYQITPKAKNVVGVSASSVHLAFLNSILQRYENILKVAPDDVFSLRRRASTLFKIALELGLEKQKGRDEIERSICAYNKLLIITPDGVRAQEAKAFALIKRAKQSLKDKQYLEATRDFDEAYATICHLQIIAPKNYWCAETSARIKHDIADIHFINGEKTAARDYYMASIQAMNGATALQPDTLDPAALWCIGDSLIRLAQLKTGRKNFKEAVEYYTKASDLDAKLIAANPNEGYLHYQRAIAMRGRGYRQYMGWEDHDEEAIISYNIAASEFAFFTELRPNNYRGWANLGQTLFFSALLEARTGKFERAEMHCREAADAFKHADSLNKGKTSFYTKLMNRRTNILGKKLSKKMR